MNAALPSLDAARLARALDRLAEHCEVVAKLNATIEDRRPVVRAALEQELGPELARVLLDGLAP
jgi:hypothetical protein